MLGMRIGFDTHPQLVTSNQLVDGQLVTPRVNPVRGAKQGCPLNPLPFALFISDIRRLIDAPDAQGQR
jgi:hypothetical protein